MAQSDSEGETIDDLEFDGTTDGEGEDDNENENENEIDEALLGALEAGVDDVTEADDESRSEDEEDEEDEEESEPSIEPTIDTGLEASSPPAQVVTATPRSSSTPESLKVVLQVRPRSPSPAQVRKRTLAFPFKHKLQLPRSFTVEAVCAIPHPVPTHALASSFCMSHLLTGSDDGYIRDYDIFTAVNGKVTLTAPQRHHCNVVEGNMKSGQIRCWWENPDLVNMQSGYPQGSETALSPVYSMAMHSDALWALGGTSRGHINLFTVRHEPGRLAHVLQGHRGPVSGLSIDHDEKGLFSASWDGEAMQWDLNTGQAVRKFTSHGAQLVGVAVRPLNTGSTQRFGSGSMSGELEGHLDGGGERLEKKKSGSAGVETLPGRTQGHCSESQNGMSGQETDARSDTSFDPLFDGEPELDGDPSGPDGGVGQGKDSHKGSAGPDVHVGLAVPPDDGRASMLAPPKNAPPLLSGENSGTFSADILMVSAIDGQTMLWDKRANTPGRGVGRLWLSEKTPPWCVSACWSTEGSYIYVGRRNGTVDVWDVRMLGRSGPTSGPRLLKVLRNPPSSGVVSCVVAIPDGRHIACASVDNIRLWNTTEGGGERGVPFKIVAGHHGGCVSQMVVDPGGRFLVSGSSNRGWHGESTRTVFVHDIRLREG